MNLSFSTVHQYILTLKGKLAKWHVKVYVNAQKMVARKDFATAQIVPGTDQFRNMDKKWFFLIMEVAISWSLRRMICQIIMLATRTI